MASTYSPLKVELIGTGEQAGTWGTTTNTNLGTALEEAITGRATATFPTDANYTLPYIDSNGAQVFRNLVLNVTSSGNLGATRDLIIPAIEKQYIVENNTSGSQSIRIKTAAGTGVTIPSGKIAHVFCDGTNTRFADNYVDITGGSISGVSLSLSSPLGVTSGGTGLATATQGDILYASGANTYAALPKNTTATRYLANTGTSNNPAWAQIDLTNGVVNTLTVANGGTGQASLTSNNVLIGNGTSAVGFVAPGTTGNLLTSNGTTWTSAAPAATVNSFSGGTTGLTPATATTGAITLAGTLNVANGGTGRSSLTSNNVILGNGTSAVQFVAPGTTGNILTSNGTTWAASNTISTTSVSATSVSATSVSATSVSATSVSTTSLSVNSSNISAVNSLSFRNRIINGNMGIDQRNAGNPVVRSPVTASYPADRWVFGCGTTTCTTQLATTTPTGQGFNNSLQLTNGTGVSPSSGQANYIAQNIEGINAVDLAFGTASAKSVTISFWVRSSITGTYSLRLTNTGNLRSYIATYSISSANTFEFKTITIPGDTTGTWNTTDGVGIQLLFDLGSGSDFVGTSGSWQSGNITRTSGSVTWVATTGATFYLTGVQLEAGTVATPFERLEVSSQLIQCQRYYNILTPLVATAGTFQVYTPIVFPVGMRIVNPTVTLDTAGASVIAVSSRGFFYLSNTTTSFTAAVSAELQ